MSTPPSPSPSSPASLQFDEQPTIREQLTKALNTSPHHTFATGAKFTPPEPHLTVDKTPIALPLTPPTAALLASLSAPSPFGRGHNTLVDPSIRRCLQVDAARVGLSSHFTEHVYEIVANVSETLGVYDDVDPELYKLVLYQDGDFFVPHRDTEKEDGMFATLVVQLPSKHEDGGLVVYHRDDEKEFMFANGSERGYFYAAFYADCEHQVFPIRGTRLVLVYNLVRSGENDYICSPIVVNKLKDIAREWEKLKGEPDKLICTLHHNYTEANLSFALLKGRDAYLVEALKRTGMYDLYLALVQKKKHGSAEEDWDDGDPYAEQDYGEDEDDDDDGSDGSRSVESSPQSPYVDTSGEHNMVECYNETFKTLEWIGEDDTRADLGTLTINVDTELVDDEDPFTGTPDDEEYEVTGNEGATVDYFYRRAVLVLWPKSRSYANACAGDYDAYVKELIDNANNEGFVAKRLGTVIQYATDHIEKGRTHFVELLKLATSQKDVQAVQQMLSLFGKPQTRIGDDYQDFVQKIFGNSDGKGAGLCTVAHIDAFLDGIKVCGFANTKEKIEAAVSVTNTESLHRCAEFAIRLSKMAGFEEVSAFVGLCTANQAMCREFGSETKVERIAEMLCTLPSLVHLRDMFVVKAKMMNPNVQYQIIKCLHEQCSTVERFPNLFEQLVREFARGAMVKKGDGVFQICAADEFAEQIAAVLCILMGPPRNEGMLESFVEKLVESGSQQVLKTGLSKRKVRAAIGDCQVEKLASVRVSQLILEKPVFSYRQADAMIVGHGEVEGFLRGEGKVMVYERFGSIKDARRFVERYFDRLDGRCGYSATAIAEGRGKDSRVVITKTDRVYRRALRRFEEDCREFSRIRHLLPGVNGNKRRRLGDGEVEVIDLTID